MTGNPTAVLGVIQGQGHMTVVWGIFSLHYEYVCPFAVLLIMYTPIKKT